MYVLAEPFQASMILKLKAKYEYCLAWLFYDDYFQNSHNILKLLEIDP